MGKMVRQDLLVKMEEMEIQEYLVSQEAMVSKNLKEKKNKVAAESFQIIQSSAIQQDQQGLYDAIFNRMLTFFFCLVGRKGDKGDKGDGGEPFTTQRGAKGVKGFPGIGGFPGDPGKMGEPGAPGRNGKSLVQILILFYSFDDVNQHSLCIGYVMGM